MIESKGERHTDMARIVAEFALALMCRTSAMHAARIAPASIRTASAGRTPASSDSGRTAAWATGAIKMPSTAHAKTDPAARLSG
ncbi:hypothetical protein [Streptosporangium roseum]|uniref:hypothetical protein n=1 Tax=Streptosporangium roseum TaxID=2001 RepID=UPI003321A5A5